MLYLAGTFAMEIKSSIVRPKLTNGPMITDEIHAYAVPPNWRARSRNVIKPANSTKPTPSGPLTFSSNGAFSAAAPLMRNRNRMRTETKLPTGSCEVEAPPPNKLLRNGTSNYRAYDTSNSKGRAHWSPIVVLSMDLVYLSTTVIRVIWEQCINLYCTSM